MSRVFSEGEVGEVADELTAGDMGGVARLIQAGPQIVYNVEDDAGQIVKSLGDFDFMNLCDSIVVAIDGMGPRLFLNDGIETSAEISNVMLCTTERAFWTGEQVRHGVRSLNFGRPS